MRRNHLILAGASAAAALLVAALVATGVSRGFDDAVLRGLATARTAGRTKLALDVTALGATPALVLAALVAALLARGRVRWAGAQLALAGALTLCADHLGKLVLARPRPTVVEHLVATQSLSFPSGHTMSTATIAFSLAILASAARAGRAARLAAWGIAGSVVAAVALTRLYLGVHYPTDVVGGALFGLTFALVADAVVARIR